MATPVAFVEGSLLTTVAATYYTVPSTVAVTAIIQSMTVVNTDTAPRTVTIYLVPDGEVAGPEYLIANAKKLAPSGSEGDTAIIYAGLGKIITSGGTIQALASMAAKVNLQASGVTF